MIFNHASLTLYLLSYFVSAVISEKSLAENALIGNGSISKTSAVSGLVKLIADKIRKNPLNTLSPRCREDLKTFFKTVLTGNLNKNTWAVEMLDASSKGLHSGSLHHIWLEAGGNFEECLNAKHPIHGFTGQYCALTATQKEEIISSVAPFLALCLPSTCSEKELQDVFYIDIESEFNVSVDLSIRSYACHSRDTIIADSRYPLAITLWLILISALFVSTLWHILQIRKVKDVKVPTLLVIFSLVNGFQNFFKVEQPANDIKIINRMRVIGMMIVIHGHTLLTLSGGPFRNAKAYASSYLTYDLIPNNFFQTVEIFFVISWILSTVSACKDLMSGSSTSQIIRRIVTRVIRFQCLLAFFMYAIVPLFPMLFEGSYMHRVVEFFSYGCKGEEWRHLTFTTTAFIKNKECQGFLWQFSTEMQITVFIPLIVVMLVKLPKLSWAILSLGSMASFSYEWYCAYYYNYFPEIFPMRDDQQIHFKRAYNRFNTLTVSLIIGLCLFKDFYVTKKSGLSKKAVLYGWTAWIIAAVMQLTFNLSYISYGAPSAHPSNLFISNILLFEKLLTPVLIGWIIYASAHGHGGIIKNNFLGNGFQNLSKLNTGISLLHATVQEIIFTSYFAPYDVNWSFRARRFFPHLVIHYAIGLLFYIIVEYPLTQAAAFTLDLIWPRQPTKTHTK